MLLKSCRCGKLIPQSMKMCEECEQRQQSRHMIYNNTRRDERAAEFYVSKEWRAMRERIIEVYDNVDIYALYVEHELLTCNPVHHIIELEDDWEQRLNPFNLIPLNHKTHNTMILKVLNEMTKGKEVTVENLDSLKDIFNEQLDPAIADNAVVITNQSGFNYLDKLKDKDGNYILQKDPTQQTKGKMLFGEYPIIKLSKKTLASEKIMNTDGHTIDGYKHPIFCGDLKEAVTLFDRNVLTIDLNDKGAGLWDKDMTGIKVRDRFDVQPVDKGAVIKGQITEVING